MYHLPLEKIATHPLNDRTASKLLVYRDGEISDRSFVDIVNEIPSGSLIIRNITRVLRARIVVPGGELFLLHPLQGSADDALAETEGVVWRCMLGNAKKILRKDTSITFEIPSQYGVITIVVSRFQDTFDGVFAWSGGMSFADILSEIGSVPLPPYMERSEEEGDNERYQSTFAQSSGSVAAPTASLHFTPEIFSALQSRGCQIADVLLHIGIGTFFPIVGDPTQHYMHGEHAQVPRSTLQAIAEFHATGAPIVCIGTTAYRVVESLAWAHAWPHFANTSRDTPNDGAPGIVPQNIWREAAPDVSQSLALLLLQPDPVTFTTYIMCMPGYPTQLCTALVTNFHQPDSTLLQLVAAFVGPDWNRVYSHALAHDYRFLSYGDGSLLFR